MSVLGLWLGRAIGSWFGPVAQDQAQEEENEGTRGGRGYRGLLPYEEPFSADDLRKLDELHEARRQALEAQQVEQPKPAEKRARRSKTRRSAVAAEADKSKVDSPPLASAVVQSIQERQAKQVVIAEAASLSTNGGQVPMLDEEEEEFAMVLMQVLLAA